MQLPKERIQRDHLIIHFLLRPLANCFLRFQFLTRTVKLDDLWSPYKYKLKFCKDNPTDFGLILTTMALS